MSETEPPPVIASAPTRPVLGFVVLSVFVVALLALSLIGQQQKSSKPSFDPSALHLILLEEGMKEQIKSADDGSLTKIVSGSNSKPGSTYKEEEKKLEKIAHRSLDQSESLVALQSLSNKEISAVDVAAIKAGSELDRDEINALTSADPKAMARVATSSPVTIGERLLRIAALRKGKFDIPRDTVYNAGSLGTLVLAGLTTLAAIGLAVIAIALSMLGQGKNWRLGCFEPSQISPQMAERYAMRGGIFLVSFVVLEVGVSLILRNGAEATVNVVLGLATIVAAVFAATVPLSGGSSDFRVAIGRARLSTGILSGLIGVGGCFLGMVVALPLITLLLPHFPEPVHPINVEISKGVNVAETVAIFFVGSFCAPFSEELIFRGFLLRAASGLTGKVWIGILLQAIIFASIHPQGVPAWPGLMAVGAALGVVYFKTGSAWPGMISHGIYNGILLALNVALTTV